MFLHENVRSWKGVVWIDVVKSEAYYEIEDGRFFYILVYNNKTGSVDTLLSR